MRDAEKFAPCRKARGLKPDLFSVIYGPTKSRALIQNMSFSAASDDYCGGLLAGVFGLPSILWTPVLVA
jgi:hypothetical protein